MAITTCALGTDSIIEIDITDITMAAAVTLGGQVTGSVSVDDDIPDATNNDDAGATSAKYGNRTVTSTFNVRYDYVGDQGQIRLLDAKIAKSETIFIRVSPRGKTASFNNVAFKAIITSLEITHDNGALVDMSVSVRSNGAVTWSAL